jgi:tetratricopeptide (TPR) repeat protein
LADLHRRIGAVHEKRGEYVQALTSVMLGTSLLTPDHTSTVEMARLLTVQCRVQHRQGQFEEAIAGGEQALAIVENTANYREIAQAHKELGNTYEIYSKPEDATVHYERALAILERIGDEHDASVIYNNLAIIYYQTDLVRSEEYFSNYLHTMQKFGNTWGESTAYQNLGIVRYAQGRYDEAIAFYQQSLHMKEQLGDSLGIADCHVNLGEVYRAQGNATQAIVHLEHALNTAQQIGANQAEAESYRQLAQCYLELNQPQSALAICETAIARAKEVGDLKEEGIIEQVVGNTLAQLGDRSAAALHLENSTRILRQLNREYDLATALYDYALILQAMQHGSAARQHLEECRRLFEQLQLPQEQKKVEEALGKLGRDN